MRATPESIPPQATLGTTLRVGDPKVAPLRANRAQWSPLHQLNSANLHVRWRIENAFRDSASAVNLPLRDIRSFGTDRRWRQATSLPVANLRSETFGWRVAGQLRRFPISRFRPPLKSLGW